MKVIEAGMMKKIFSLILTLGLAVPACFAAEVLHVEALTSFSTDKYPASVKLKALTPIQFSPNLEIKEDYILTGKLIDVSSPKRLKRNAKFSFIPMSYTDTNGVTTKITEPFEGRYSAKLDIDKGQIAKSAALGVGSYFVKGVSLGYYAVEGAVKNESDNRFKSSVKSVYKNSPLSYVEKGQDIVINIHDVFALKFDIEEPEVIEVAPGEFQEGNFEYKMQ